jgi:hypothetical protein
VTWLRLSEATTLIHHDVQKARERLQRAISKAWLVPLDVLPQQTSDPNVPLRIQVTLPSGLRIEGRGWLENPVLDWEKTEIECLYKPWAPMSRVPSLRPKRKRKSKFGARTLYVYGEATNQRGERVPSVTDRR